MSAPGEPTSWATNLANIFLTPFGLGASASSVSAAGTKGDVLNHTQQQQLPQGFPVHVACQDDRWAEQLYRSSATADIAARVPWS